MSRSRIDEVLIVWLVWASSVLVGLAVADVAIHEGLPKVWTVVLGAWAFLAVLAILRALAEPHTRDG